MMMTANKSGIGLSAANIRGLGANIGPGRVKHTGILPIIKTWQSATAAFTQEGRGGAASVSYAFFNCLLIGMHYDGFKVFSFDTSRVSLELIDQIDTR